jgi:hypothetical protein
MGTVTIAVSPVTGQALVFKIAGVRMQVLDMGYVKEEVLSNLIKELTLAFRNVGEEMLELVMAHVKEPAMVNSVREPALVFKINGAVIPHRN